MTKHLPRAPHTYFRTLNSEEAREAFFENPDSNPHFVYAEYDKRELLALRDGIYGHEEKMKIAIELVIASMELRERPDEKNLARFRMINEKLYGAPSKKNAYAILARSLRKATPETQHLADYIMHRVPNIPMKVTMYKPSPETVDTLRSYIQDYADPSQFQESMSLPRMLTLALERTGLAKDGWRVEVEDSPTHAITVHRLKKIITGERYRPRTMVSKVQIVLHEVYGHALRGHQDDISESEGFASLLEQLALPYYASRRSYRFLAAALGWGTVAPPMDFRDNYEILWRIMTVGGYYGEEDAKRHAFAECLRVYRGGNPAVAGAVFLKDSLYFTANIEIWHQIEKKHPSYEEFCEIIEGKRKILS